MLTRKLAIGLILAGAASVTGCKSCCPGGQNCNSPAIIRSAPIMPAPCNSCGTPGVVVPPPPGAVAPAPGGPYAPPPGPYGGASFERKT